jgi:hypothetical protein
MSILAPHDLRVLATVIVTGATCGVLTWIGRTLMPHDRNRHD